MHELHSHNVNGKGDKERSPGWRNNYNEIQNFQKDQIPGLVKLAPGRYRKCYGSPVSPARGNLGVAVENFDTGEIEILGVTGRFRIAVEDDREPSDVPAVPQDQCGDSLGGSPRSAGSH